MSACLDKPTGQVRVSVKWREGKDKVDRVYIVNKATGKMIVKLVFYPEQSTSALLKDINVGDVISISFYSRSIYPEYKGGIIHTMTITYGGG